MTPARARVLVVEDQALIALSLIADLSSLGCEVVARSATGERAIELARHYAPDIVFMDVHLGGDINGIEAASRIRLDCLACIVFITAHADGPERARMEALSPAAILGKPYDPQDLANVVQLAAGTERRWLQRFISASR
ncbi:MAG: response regulator [Alphaproteobacteria bacterium]